MKSILTVTLFGLSVWFPVNAEQSLARLTVPVAGLPGNCKLAEGKLDKRGQPDVIMWPTLRDNPWVGNRAITLAEIRAHVENSHPKDGEKYPEFYDRIAEHVVEGYRALYMTPDGGKIDVAGVRFDNPQLTALAGMRRLSGDVPNIVFGATAVRITNPQRGRVVPTEPCYDAIRAYISSLK